ncbi:type II toxin-antitoxin system PemK/MazF family toxin (plasmid) [Limosilactobacillus reuteri]|uniref:Type II toxin-antitoxin system PemK/MazF family toxin n=1 Tax=Limosilactobacillus reuteri TaxID=1598 RepID=A0A517D8K1_LIMRT|nr:type II toxin-antitoxin system PemK/MazF family toxin [Limosilactobacillus reuteri]QDR73682.1 type II toxin-antitoxin system PemK/MazF family toxin [Limosilactobacillus reuteri]
MKINEIYTAYVSWGTGGKRRPVLVIKSDEDFFEFYNITSKYNEKSRFIQRQYYPIKYWKESGLKKQSYVDVGRILNLPVEAVVLKFVGELTRDDKIGLANFISNLDY